MQFIDRPKMPLYIMVTQKHKCLCVFLNKTLCTTTLNIAEVASEVGAGVTTAKGWENPARILKRIQ